MPRMILGMFGIQLAQQVQIRPLMLRRDALWRSQIENR
jgi:hypothetical protein